MCLKYPPVLKVLVYNVAMDYAIAPQIDLNKKKCYFSLEELNILFLKGTYKFLQGALPAGLKTVPAIPLKPCKHYRHYGHYGRYGRCVSSNALAYMIRWERV